MGASSEVIQSSTRLYRRELPGAGYVAIDLTRVDESEIDGERTRIRVYVERRANEERRAGHNPPIVAELPGDLDGPELGELYRMAGDNAALARELLAWQSRRLKKVRAD